MMKNTILIFILMIFTNVWALNIPQEVVQSGVSLVIPGLGLIKVQEENTSRIFAGAEIVIAATSISLFLKSEYEENNSIDFASYSLNKDISYYPEEVLLKMESYMSSDEYNASLPVKARQLYPNNVESQISYIESNLIPDSLSWDYSSEVIKNQYSSMRASSRRFREYMFYSFSALAVNHVSSAIFTYFKASEFFKPVKFNGGFGMNSFIFSSGVNF